MTMKPEDDNLALEMLNELMQTHSRKSNFDKVMEFQKAIADALQKPLKETPSFPPPATVVLRTGLIDEENKELKDAIAKSDIVEVADALIDLLYVIYGMGIEFGLPMNKLFDEVHESNMTKFDDLGKPIFRASDMKVMKGPNYRPPNLKKILFPEAE